ncbi:TPA: AAA family ATPase [Streptococcus suis]
MITEIALPSDRFSAQTLDNLKRKNFIYGKNGAGKSSITEAIRAQYGETHDVRIFQGFNSVAENERLDAISLGIENAELQPQIEAVNKKIDDIKLQIQETDAENLYKQFKHAERERNDCRDKLSRFYSTSASELKNSYTGLTGANYNTRNFQNDIPKSLELSDGEAKRLENLKNQVALPQVIEQQVAFEDLGKYLTATNDILTTELIPSIILKFKSSQEANWAREGMHYHEAGAMCAFCGNEVSEERLENLNSFFDDQVKKFEDRINNAITKISYAKQVAKATKKIEKNLFYPQFHEKIQTINLEINEYVAEYVNFLDILEEQLLERRSNLFTTKLEIVDTIPEAIDPTIAQYKKLCEENNKFSANLNIEKQQARERLRLNLVAKKLKDFDYSNFVTKGKVLEENYTRIKREFDAKKIELDNLEKELNSLLSRSVDESIAAERINKYLRGLGEQSFQLILVEGEQKGQYAVQDMQGNKRSISTLSTGEKNIVAFLWFVLDLENPDKLTEKQRIIVFDDPMNSNDDTTQYLIIISIQNLLKNLNDTDQVFILTHNVHFYINVRHNWWNGSTKPNYEKTTIHLVKSPAGSSFRLLASAVEDLKTTYEALWAELRWMYEQHKPEFMLNPIRRIFETYGKFNQIDASVLYRGNEVAKKLFNVNSHSVEDIEDFSSDPNGKSREEIMNLVKEIFDNNNAMNHFNKHWKREVSDD